MTDDSLGNSIESVAKAAMAARAEADLIRIAYAALPREWLRERLLVEYRCPNRRGCLLAHVWRGDDGIAYYYLSDYKLSRERSEERTVASARAENTLDGDRHWKPRAGNLDSMLRWGASVGLDLQCDHLSPVAIRPKDLVADAAKATRGKPYRRFITARFA